MIINYLKDFNIEVVSCLIQLHLTRKHFCLVVMHIILNLKLCYSYIIHLYFCIVHVLGGTMCH